MHNSLLEDTYHCCYAITIESGARHRHLLENIPHNQPQRGVHQLSLVELFDMDSIARQSSCMLFNISGLVSSSGGGSVSLNVNRSPYDIPGYVSHVPIYTKSV